MKTFEERYTAWVDGRLAEPELSAFERELPDRAAAEADREEVHRLTRTLRSMAAPPSLTNPEFFSHQLLERMAADDRRGKAAPRARGSFFSLPNLAWAGACSLFLAFGLYHALIPPRPGAEGFASVTNRGSDKVLPISAAHLASDSASEADPTVYDASIIEATPQEPGITATSIHSKTENMTVLWLDGLDYLPASYELE